MKYAIDCDQLYIHWSLHLTVGYIMEGGVDGRYIAFDDQMEAELFVMEVNEALNIDSELELHSYDGDFNAIKVSELLELIDNVQLTA